MRIHTKVERIVRRQWGPWELVNDTAALGSAHCACGAWSIGEGGGHIKMVALKRAQYGHCEVCKRIWRVLRRRGRARTPSRAAGHRWQRVPAAIECMRPYKFFTQVPM